MRSPGKAKQAHTHAPNVNPYVAIRALLTMMSPTDVVTLKLHDARSSAALLSGFFFGVGEAEAAVSGLMVAGCLSLAGLRSHRRGGWRHRGRSSPGVQSVVLREERARSVGLVKHTRTESTAAAGGGGGGEQQRQGQQKQRRKSRGEGEKRISAHHPPPDRSCSCCCSSSSGTTQRDNGDGSEAACLLVFDLCSRLASVCCLFDCPFPPFRPAIYTQLTPLLWVFFLPTTWSSRQIYY